MQTLALIGAGNITHNLVAGLIASGYPPSKIWVSNPSLAKLDSLKEHFDIHTTTDNQIAVEYADVVMLCVKPIIVPTVVQEIAHIVQKKHPLVISVATGIPIETFEKIFGKNTAIIRCMPNTPVHVGCGASGLFANSHCSEEQKSTAESIMRSVGITVWLEEEAQIDTVTALSGSGPAYFFLMMEALQQAGIKLGLPPTTAELLTIQTAFGAARMALESNIDLIALRKQVTPVGGTTERATQVFEEGHIHELFARAVQAAQQRAKELSGKS